jgi:hypothetical protein
VASVRVRLDRPLTGHAPDDASAVARAIRSGHMYTAVDAIASPPALEFTATNERGTAHQGDELAAGGALLLRVRSNAPPEFTTIVYEGLRALTTVRDARDLSVHASDRPGVYWTEIVSTGRRFPQTWIRSNPIYVRGIASPAAPPPPPKSPEARLSLIDEGAATNWNVEHDPRSQASVDVARGEDGLVMRYALSAGANAHQFSGLVAATPNGLRPYDRLAVVARAEHPMRVSVQVRTEDAKERWQRSIYVDTSDQRRTVVFDDMTPVGATSSPRPRLDRIGSVLFVVETTNAKPGSSGRLWVKAATLEK